MRGSLQIANFFDIPVRVHWSFLLLLAFAGISSQRLGDTWSETGWTFLFVGAIFACVVLHEFGHALMARRFGVGTKDIILLPIGGLARLYALPEQPGQELLVAIAGPLVNLVIALLLSPIVWWQSGDEFHQLFRFFLGISPIIGSQEATFVQYFIPALLLLNIILALFNLLPAFPMDGGRILRALLSYRMPRLKATRVAVRIGQILAILLSVYSVFDEKYSTALIGIFVFYMAQVEYRYAKINHALAANATAGPASPSPTESHPPTPPHIQ